jgi:cytochrome c oxidase subunit II
VTSYGSAVFVANCILAVCIIGLMTLVALSSRGGSVPQQTVTKTGYAIRRLWFVALVIVLVAGFLLTLPRFPYPRAGADQGVQHYEIDARQYSFTVPAAVPLNRPIVFDVTSGDVNHGFGIYDPAGRLVGQVQAMPDYVNHLPYTFTVPGAYTVRCLEFCGVGHAYMHAQFEVR